MVKPRSRKNRYVPVIAIGLTVCLLGVGAVAFVRGVLSGGAPPAKKVVQEIHVIRPPPPPPDLPPPPPPPPEEKVDVPDPQQKPDPTPSNEPPPAEQLGLDAAGTAGGDAFGLLGNQGGRDLVGSGGNAYVWYAGIIKNELVDQLSTQKGALAGDYSVTVRIWLRGDGTIERWSTVRSNGNPEHIRAIEDRLAHLGKFPQPPPPDTPNPLQIQIGTLRSPG
jgi:periplasmic protein TonB